MEALAVNNQVFLASSIKCVKTGKCVYGNCSEEQDRGKLSNNLTTVWEAKELMGALEDCMNEIEVLSHSQSGPGAYRGGSLGPISPHPRNDVLALLLLCLIAECISLRSTIIMALVSVPVVTALLELHSLWALVLVGLVVRAIVRRYWTPIRDIPGPFLASFSKLWQVYQLWKGHIEEELICLHKKHGIIPKLAFLMYSF